MAHICPTENATYSLGSYLYYRAWGRWGSDRNLADEQRPHMDFCQEADTVSEKAASSKGMSPMCIVTLAGSNA